MARSRMPPFVEPEKATLVREPLRGDGWLHEIKLDGYRGMVRVDGDDLRFLTSRGNDWSAMVPTILESVGKLGLGRAYLDGELVVLDERGISDFQGLQNALGTTGGTGALLYHVFDALFLDDEDIRALPIEDRKARLRAALGKSPPKNIRFSDHVVGDGPRFFESARDLGLEGVITKRAGTTYVSGRSRDWLKVKCLGRQEFVVVGYTEPDGSRRHLGALLIATRAKGKDLTFAGKVGTGFTERSLADLGKRLSPLARNTAPLEDPPRAAELGRVHWVEPKLVVEIGYSSVTREGKLRHPVFFGLRDDKPASKVVFEEARPKPDR